MLNKELIPDPKDRLIAHLKMTISKFKEYDEQRKAYVKSIEAEVQTYKNMYEDLLSQLQEDATEKYKKLKQKHENLVRAHQICTRNLNLCRNFEQVQEFVKQYPSIDSITHIIRENEQLKERVTTLKKHDKDQQEIIKDLIYKLNKYKC